MSTADPKQNGKIVWRDLTVSDASQVASFYKAVVGWSSRDHDMGEYADYEMLASEDGECVAGICHARGSNEGMPAQWLLYVQVPDVETAAKEASARGGKVLNGPRRMGAQQFCVVQDPAGAVLGLIGPAPEA